MTSAGIFKHENNRNERGRKERLSLRPHFSQSRHARSVNLSKRGKNRHALIVEGSSKKREQ